MDKESISITNIPEISAIYFALLQSGYDFFSAARDTKHVQTIQNFAASTTISRFFFDVKQNTCEVYPYWPRAAILETATFFLRPDHQQFAEYKIFYNRIMSASNISDRERDDSLWKWISAFPTALDEVLSNNKFQLYLEWENKWIAEQNIKYKKELYHIQKCLDMCVNKYRSTVKDIQIVMNPIKCVYSADYHMVGNCFIFCSGAFRMDSVIHEFFHHVVHPYIVAHEQMIAERKTAYPDIDTSYYLSGGTAGQLNAFEEYMVRELTKDVLAMNFPRDIDSYLENLARA